MTSRIPKHCAACGAPLAQKALVVEGGKGRLVCTGEACGRIAYVNPLPVAAAIVQLGDAVLLVQNKGWPAHWFGLVTGFVEVGETCAEAALRELREELGLEGTLRGLVGVYDFLPRGELIVAFHVEVAADANPRLGDELAAFKAVPLTKLKPWPGGTGDAVRDFLARGVLPH